MAKEKKLSGAKSAEAESEGGKKDNKKPLNVKLIILAIVFLAIVGVVVWLLIKNNNSANSGQVQGTKTDQSQIQETAKTVPESKYFSDKAKIMIFYSDTCHWCQQEKQVLGELGYEGYRFKPMNVGNDPSLWEKFKISGTPTFVADDGDRLIGFREKAELKSWLDDHGAKPTK
jgi:thiol-disulfide isomerase/thioredoxin